MEWAPHRSRPAPAILGVLTAAAVLLAAFPCTLRAGGKDNDGKKLPWTIGLDVHWGEHRNRESYRSGLEKLFHAKLSKEGCFADVLATDSADLVLDVQIDDLLSEEEYSSPESIPGEGEVHELRSARIKLRLDFSLRTPGPGGTEVRGARFNRELARQPANPRDPVEERAMREISLDASEWLLKNLCGHREALSEAIGTALVKKPPPPPPPAK